MFWGTLELGRCFLEIFFLKRRRFTKTVAHIDMLSVSSGTLLIFWEISSWLKETEDLGTRFKTIKPSKSLAFYNEMSQKLG